MTEAIAEQKSRPIRVLILWNQHDAIPQQVAGSAAGDEPSPPGTVEEPAEIMPDERVEPVLPRSAALAAELAQVLEDQGLEVSAFDVEDDPMRILDAITVARPALVFNLVEQFYGDTTMHAHMAAFLDLFGVPYTGSDSLCLATCQDRVRTHLVLDNAGIPVPRFEVIRDVNVIPDSEGFRFPIIVTQAFDDLYEEEGMERPIVDHEALVARSSALFKEFDLPYLVEEYIQDRRLHAIVMGNRALEVLPLVEFDVEDDMDAPWALAQLDYETVDRVRQLARRAFRVMGCRDIAQIDFHLDHDNNPCIVDVRPMFDMGPGSVFRGAAEHTAGGYEGAVIELIKLTCKRAQLGAAEAQETLPPDVTLAASDQPTLDSSGDETWPAGGEDESDEDESDEDEDESDEDEDEGEFDEEEGDEDEGDEEEGDEDEGDEDEGDEDEGDEDEGDGDEDWPEGDDDESDDNEGTRPGPG